MVGNKTTKKTRKPIETTLGRAPVKPKEKEPDISALRQPIETSIRGAREIAALLTTGTDEVRQLISYECDLMYECRICKSIFRCLSNFLLHKRKYCTEKFNPACSLDNNETQIVGPPEEPATKISSLDKIVERLREIENVSEAAKESLAELFTDTAEKQTSEFTHLMLEKIDSNDSGIFQTLVNGETNKPKELTKTQVMENYKKLENDVPVLDPEGKICGFTSNKHYQQSLFPKFSFPCNQCNHKFATRKSLNNHIKCIHNPNKMLYFCPICKETLANPWCVYRHMLRVHKMTTKHVRRMRDHVTNSSVLRKDEDTIKKKKVAEPIQSLDSESQWLNDIEGDKDFQMCAGCGRHFERKAALLGHLQSCVKRMEVCNSIKENAKRREEKLEKAKLSKMPIVEKRITGALRRKRPTIYSFPRKRNNLSGSIDEENNSSTENIGKNLNRLKDNKIASSPVQNEMQEALSQLVNNNIPITITETLLAKELISNDATFPLLQEANNIPEIEQIDDIKVFPLNNVESLLLDHPPENYGGNSSFSAECDNPGEDLEIIELVDDEAPELDLLSDGVSFEAFCQKINTIYPNGNSLLDKLPSTNNDVIVIDEEEIIDNDVGDQINPMELQQGEKQIVNAKKQKTKKHFQQAEVEVIKRKQGAHSIQKKYSDKPKTRKKVQFAHQIKHKQQADDTQIKDTDKHETGKNVQQADPIEQNQQANEIDEPKSKQNLQQADDKQISNTEELNTEAAYQDGTQITKAGEEIMKEKIKFPQCALPYIVPLELLCVPCDKKFNSTDELECHMSGHFSWFRFQCTKCSFVSFKKEDCIIHVQERHNLAENAVSRCIVPMPYWRAERISHDYMPLTDMDLVGGTYTDEDIGGGEITEPIADTVGESVAARESNSLFCGNLLTRENTNETDAENKNTQPIQYAIDIAETIDDDQLLPEPIEMTFPVDTSTVFKAPSPDKESDECTLKLDTEGDESNDDWGLSEVCVKQRQLAKKSEMIKKPIPEPVPIVRAARMRTKVKHKEDFFYYDSNTSLNELTRNVTVPTNPKKKREK